MSAENLQLPQERGQERGSVSCSSTLPPPSRLHQPSWEPDTSRYSAPPLLALVTLKILTIWLPQKGGGRQDPTLSRLLAQLCLQGTLPESSPFGPLLSPSLGRPSEDLGS